MSMSPRTIMNLMFRRESALRGELGDAANTLAPQGSKYFGSPPRRVTGVATVLTASVGNVDAAWSGMLGNWNPWPDECNAAGGTWGTLGVSGAGVEDVLPILETALDGGSYDGVSTSASAGQVGAFRTAIDGTGYTGDAFGDPLADLLEYASANVT